MTLQARQNISPGKYENELNGQRVSAVISSKWLNLSKWIYEQDDRLQTNVNSTDNTS